jgi:transcriptional regulator with XRE-family HTH domain
MVGWRSALRIARLRSGKSLRAVARATGLSPAHLSRLECDPEHYPSLPVARMLARHFGATIEALFPDEVDERQERA